MFDSTKDVDKEGGAFPEIGGDLDIIERTVNEGGDPRGEIGFFDDVE